MQMEDPSQAEFDKKKFYDQFKKDEPLADL